MALTQVLVAVTMDSGPLHIRSFLTRARGDLLPFGARWDNRAPGWWTRDPTPENLINEVTRSYPPVINGVAQPQPLHWRVIQQADLPSDRAQRNEWIDTGTAITIREQELGF